MEDKLEGLNRLLQSLLQGVETALETRDVNYIEYGRRQLQIYIQITFAFVHVLTQNGHNRYANLLEQLALELTFQHHIMDNFIENSNQTVKQNYVNLQRENSTGERPRFKIDAADIVSLKEFGFSWVSIAQILGISESTLRRRRGEFGISFDYSDVSDEEFDTIIKNILKRTPNVGETLVMGSLRAQGFRIQCARIRARLSIVDELGRGLQC
eukprot:gene8328-9222_t